MQSIVLVLLVEDEHLIRDLMQIALEDGGFDVLAAENGEDAFAKLEEHGDAIKGLVTDIRLGDGPTGWEIARRVRHDIPDLPVVYMTADSAADWAAEGVPKSILVQKPFVPAQVLTAITTLLNDNSSTLLSW